MYSQLSVLASHEFNGGIRLVSSKMRCLKRNDDRKPVFLAIVINDPQIACADCEETGFSGMHRRRASRLGAPAWLNPRFSRSILFPEPRICGFSGESGRPALMQGCFPSKLFYLPCKKIGFPSKVFHFPCKVNDLSWKFFDLPWKVNDFPCKFFRFSCKKNELSSKVNGFSSKINSLSWK